MRLVPTIALVGMLLGPTLAQGQEDLPDDYVVLPGPGVAVHKSCLRFAPNGAVGDENAIYDAQGNYLFPVETCSYPTIHMAPTDAATWSTQGRVIQAYVNQDSAYWNNYGWNYLQESAYGP